MRRARQDARTERGQGAGGSRSARNGAGSITACCTTPILPANGRPSAGGSVDGTLPRVEPVGRTPDPPSSRGSAFTPTPFLHMTHPVGLKPDPQPCALRCGSAFRPTPFLHMTHPVGLAPGPQPRALHRGSAFRPTPFLRMTHPVGLKPDPQRRAIPWVGLQADAFPSHDASRRAQARPTTSRPALWLGLQVDAFPSHDASRRAEARPTPPRHPVGRPSGRRLSFA